MLLHKKAFTLIELLVVIAIIAILAAILFPVFAQAKKAAKTTAALSNAKQIGLSYVMYVNDYDDNTPMLRFWTNNVVWSTWYTWRSAVYPYVKNPQVWLDPNAPSAQSELTEDSANPGDGWNDGAVIADVCGTQAEQFALDGGSNWKADAAMKCRSNYVANGTVDNGMSMTQAANPATLLLVESSRGWWEDLGYWWPMFTPGWHNSTGDLDLWNDGGGAMSFWHNKGGIYIFHDSHAKRLSAYATFQHGDKFMWDNPGVESDNTIDSWVQLIHDNFVYNGQEVY